MKFKFILSIAMLSCAEDKDTEVINVPDVCVEIIQYARTSSNYTNLACLDKDEQTRYFVSSTLG
jgi:tRNA-binding EMAP/Myf-like protein